MDHEDEHPLALQIHSTNDSSSPVPLKAVYKNNNKFINGKRNSDECDKEDEETMTKKQRVGCGALVSVKTPKQFWKAGDYDPQCPLDDHHSGFADHVRVHPRFLHSNATSHKWALGAFAELLDNALDEACNGATYVNVDVLTNNKNNKQMLLIEDNGGGMDPDNMRQCMSLGYSEKSKMVNTIGQYGNGFKTSTMRLGADVIVFSRSKGKNQTSPTQSIGLLSYTFLRSTGKQDIVVPMVDYEKHGQGWRPSSRMSSHHFDVNLNTIIEWSPYQNEEELNQQLDTLNDHGTRIIIYNLWEDDSGPGEPELDLTSDPYDILTRDRDEKKEELAKKYPNLRSLFTYQFSLRSYASILYLTLPPEFRICLRGVDVVHHKLVDNLMMEKHHTYSPFIEGTKKRNPNISAVTTLGFVKEAKEHVDIQGFNVYHKNRLIVPLWRVWNAAGTGGRGVVGVLEANFIEPSHNKQGFECTKMMAKLVSRLGEIQKDYWYANSHEVGYVGRPQSTKSTASKTSSMSSDLVKITPSINEYPASLYREQLQNTPVNVHDQHHQVIDTMTTSAGIVNDEYIPIEKANAAVPSCTTQRTSKQQLKNPLTAKMDELIVTKLRDRNLQLKERLHIMKEPSIIKLRKEVEQEKEKRLELVKRLEEAKENLLLADKEHEALADVFREERESRIKYEETLRTKLREIVGMRQSLVEKLKKLEHNDVNAIASLSSCKQEPK